MEWIDALMQRLRGGAQTSRDMLNQIPGPGGTIPAQSTYGDRTTPPSYSLDRLRMLEQMQQANPPGGMMNQDPNENAFIRAMRGR